MNMDPLLAMIPQFILNWAYTRFPGIIDKVVTHARARERVLRLTVFASVLSRFHIAISSIWSLASVGHCFIGAQVRAGIAKDNAPAEAPKSSGWGLW